MTSSPRCRRWVGTMLAAVFALAGLAVASPIASPASRAEPDAARSAQSAYGCVPITTRVELAENAGGDDVYTALPRSRSTSFVARFVAKPKNTGPQDPRPGVCVFALRLEGLEFVKGGSLPVGVVLDAGGSSATWTLNFAAGQAPRVSLQVRARSSKTKTAKLAIAGKADAGAITAYATSLKAARPLKAAGAIALDAQRGPLRENRRRVFTGTIDVPRCAAADTGTLRLYFTLPNGLRGAYPQPVVLAKQLKTVKQVRVPRCRFSVAVRFFAVRQFAGKALTFQIRSSRGVRSKTRRIRVPAA